MLGIKIPDKYKEEEVFEIWKDHSQALQLFLSVSDQWRVIVTPSRLCYQAIEMSAFAHAMDIFGVEDKVKSLQQVKLIQQGALEILNK